APGDNTILSWDFTTPQILNSLSEGATTTDESHVTDGTKAMTILKRTVETWEYGKYLALQTSIQIVVRH
ncbi:MAG: hypothetical protein Q7S00_01695, partial [bacterium]|nr:hypothetical protein [bacterium]